MSSVAANVARYRSQIPSHVELVAVSKTKPVDLILEAYSAGQRHFGENYVQELIEKAPSLPSDIKWHFIGHLQTNKINALLKNVPNLWMVESVDSVKLADVLNAACQRLALRDRLRVLVEVSTSDEESKTGIAPSEAESLGQHIIMNCASLHFCGLMTVANPIEPAVSFNILADLRESITSNLGLPADSMILSMGMSGDWEGAIALGASEVRLGSSIFGTRV